MSQPPGGASLTLENLAINGPIRIEEALSFPLMLPGIVAFTAFFVSIIILLSFLFTIQPKYFKIPAICLTSSMSGQLLITVTELLRSEAAIIGNTAFFAPAISTQP